MTFLRRLVDKANKTATAPSHNNHDPVLDYEDLQRTTVLYSQPYSGCEALKSALAQLTGMHLPAAPFNVHTTNHDEYTYRTFVDDDPQRLRDALIDPTAALYKFLGAFLSKQPRTGPILLDISYGQATGMGVDDAEMMPLILKVLKHLDVPVVHLIRRDFVAQAIMLALQGNTQDDDAPQMWLDPERVLKTATARRDAARDAARQLDFIDLRTITITHEDLTSSRNADHLRRVLKHIDIYSDIPDGFAHATQGSDDFRLLANLNEIRDFAAANDPQFIF